MKIRGDYAAVIGIDVAMYLYILLTNFSDKYINTLFIVLLLASALILKGSLTIMHFPVIIIYFGFTYLEFDNIFGMAKSQFLTFYTLAFVVRNIKAMMQNFLTNKSGFRTFLLFVFAALLLFQREYFGVIKLVLVVLFCAYFASQMEKNGDFARNLAFMLFGALISTYLYNLIHVQIFTLPAAAYEALEGRYGGTRDPNDFALFSNICIILLEYTGAKNNTRKSTVPLLILVVGILITISMSGIFSLMVILCLKYFGIGFWKQGNGHLRIQKRKVHNLFITIGLLVVVCVLEAFLNNNSVVLKVLSRIAQINDNIAAGDFSTATSSRSYLWSYYMSHWLELPLFNRVIGSYDTYAFLIINTMASHNSYIDLLMTYGILGVSLLAVYFVVRWTKRTSREASALKLLQFLFAVNMIFRSYDIQSASLFAFLLL